jgi:hypothetical protein
LGRVALVDPVGPAAQFMDAVADGRGDREAVAGRLVEGLGEHVGDAEDLVGEAAWSGGEVAGAGQARDRTSQGRSPRDETASLPITGWCHWLLMSTARGFHAPLLIALGLWIAASAHGLRRICGLR